MSKNMELTMSIKKLPKALNPKKAEDYAKMFSKYVELGKPYLKLVEYVTTSKDWGNKETQKVLDHVLFGTGGKARFKTFDLELHVNNAKAIIDTLKRNDRIESYIKNERAYYCIMFVNEYERIVKFTYKDGMDDAEFLTALTMKKSEDMKQELLANINYYLKEMKPLYDYCLKDFENYVEKTALSFDESLEPSVNAPALILSDIVHYLDVYETNKNKYKKINDLSWAGKSVTKVLGEFEEIEQKIIETSGDFNEAEYKRAFDQRKHEEEYLDVGDGYVWWILEGGNHPFESYIGSRPYGAGNHCGRDSSDVFFSLRTNKDGFFISHATISASIKKIKNEKLDIPAVFVLNQLKGPANSPIKPQLWKYVVKLILEDEIGYQDSSGRYQSEKDFHISWLIDKHHDDGHSVLGHFSDDYNFQANEKELQEFEKMYKKIITKKPWFESRFKSEMRFGILKDKREFTAKYWGAEKVELTDTFYLKYYSLEDLLSGISNVWGRKHGFLETCASTLRDHVDYTSEYSEIPYDDFFLYIKNKEKTKYKKIIDAMEKLGMENISDLTNIHLYDADDDAHQYLDSVRDAFYAAYYTGWEVGSQDEKYRQYELYFDGLEVENENPQTAGAEESDEVVLKIYKDEDSAQGEPSWIVKFNVGYLEFHDPNDSVGDDQFKVNIGRSDHIGFDYEYSEDAAAERLFEELPD